MIRAVLLLMCLPHMAHAACRQALALGLDVSGSVDAVEYRQQLDGVAAALQSRAVQDVLFMHPGAPITVAVYEWSGPEDQSVILPWTPITDPAALTAAVAQLQANQRQPAAPTTAIGSAMLAGFVLLDQQPTCWKRTLDLSGDGRANTGPRPQDIAPRLLPTGVVVNGLVINGATDAELATYYKSYVVRGTGAFVETATGFADYAQAMERKLLRELESMVMGAADMQTSLSNQ